MSRVLVLPIAEDVFFATSVDAAGAAVAASGLSTGHLVLCVTACGVVVGFIIDVVIIAWPRKSTPQPSGLSSSCDSFPDKEFTTNL